MTADHLLAIDVGTQSARAAVFDRGGQMLACAQELLDPPFTAPQPGWAETDPTRYWHALAAACQALWARGDVAPGLLHGRAG